MAKVGGSVWIDGATFHFVSYDGASYTITGTYVGSGAGTVNGSIWIDGDTIHFIGGDNNHYTLPSSAYAARSAVAGSIWVDNGNYVANKALRYISASAVERYMHYDVSTYTDQWSNNVHTDTWRLNIAYQNYLDHAPTAGYSLAAGTEHYYDTGGGGYHADYLDHSDGTAHTDSGSYNDVDYVDHTHGDHNDTDHLDDEGGNYHDIGNPGPHGDYSDHGDSGSYRDIDYTDHTLGGHSDHTDAVYADQNNPYGSGSGGYNDHRHVDSKYTDIAYQDQPTTHSDAGHTSHDGYVHTDTPAHNNHTHDDTVYTDLPTSEGA